MEKVDELAKILWDYNQMHHTLAPSDAIIALGSMDTRVAEKSADLWHEKLSPIVVVSGGFGRLTGLDRSATEADKFKRTLLLKNVPEQAIIVEDKSTNMAENFIFSVKLLRKAVPNLSSVIVVTKPYAEKRAYATIKKLFPDLKVLLTSPQISYEEYPHGEITIDIMLNVMIGDTQRIKLYTDKGFTIQQDMPSEVESAMNALIELGYDEQLTK
ncbi:YdcF family protein [soil metagenome]